MKKRIASLLLAVLMTVTLLPTTVWAETTIGTCGDNLTWTLEDGVLTISGTGEMGDYTYNTVPWKGKEITSAVIENGVTSIGSHAFYKCNKLASIVIPESVTSVGTYAFYDCSDLISVTIPGTVVSIGDSAFEDCCGLLEVTISEGVTELGESAFDGCTELEEVELPESVTYVGDYAFNYCTSLKRAELPGNITYIGECAFKSCISLKTINLPDKVTNDLILKSTFEGCASLEAITISDGVVTLNGTFKRCSSLTAITIPDSVTSIGRDTFYDCIGLKEIIIPDGVTSIGDNTFYGCVGLMTVTIPGSVTRIAANAFGGCISLATIYYNGRESDWKASGADVSASGDVQVICLWIAYGTYGDNLTWQLKPDGTMTITGSGELEGGVASNFPWHDYRNSIKVLVLDSNITAIGQYAFDHCENLTEVRFSEGKSALTLVGECAFASCCKLERFPFDKMTVLETIEMEAFCGSGLSGNVVLPDGLRTIGNTAFQKIPAKSVVIPATVTKIESYAFYECSNLTDIFFRGTKEAWESAQTYSLVYQPVPIHIGTCQPGYETTTTEAVAPTCTEAGKNSDTVCATCGVVITAGTTIPAKGHTEVIDAAVAATCTETGLTEGKHCSVCNEVLVAQTTISANGHTEVIDAAVAATCTKPGLTEGKHCSVCGEVLVAQTTLPAKGHTEVTDEAVAATCAETGLTEGKHCSVCNEVLVAQEVIPMLGSMPGDVNGDNKVDILDVACLYKYLTTSVREGALKNHEAVFFAAADINGDKSIDVYDIQRLYEAVALGQPLEQPSGGAEETEA